MIVRLVISRRSLWPTSAQIRLLGVVLVCSTLIFGCAQIRKVTYPQNFVYLEKKEVDSQMVLLSLYVRQLDEFLKVDSGIKDQTAVLGVLSKMQASAEKLGASGIDTNHLVIDDHLDQFKSDVFVAIDTASANPPNYYAAGQIYGSCIACHQFR